jgi:hypothetical protein
MHTSHFSRIRYKLCKFGCDWLLIKGTLLVKAVSQLPFELLSCKSIPRASLFAIGLQLRTLGEL